MANESNSSSTSGAGAPAVAPVTHTPRRVTTIIIALIVLGIAVAGLWFYWQHRERYPKSRDALLHANVVVIAPQVDGIVSVIHVRDNQVVKAGDLLFEIDPHPFQVILDGAKARLVVVKNEIEADNAQIKLKQADVDAANAEVDRVKAAEAFAKRTFDETNQAFDSGAATQEEMNQARDNHLEAQAAVTSAEAAVAAAKADLDATIARIGTPEVQQARIAEAEAAVRTAEINLAYCTVTAPTDGIVTQFLLRAGQVVKAQQAIFPFIEAGEWWATANYKETDMRAIRPGQPARITVDMYPGRTFDGVVESIGRGSAAAFSLLPPQNTTGNWVKVTQRIPVRIRLTEVPDTPFRHGASCEVEVNTVDEGGAPRLANAS